MKHTLTLLTALLLAPQEYSWAWTGIVDHDQDARAGFFLGINHVGQVGFYASVDGQWLGCDSKEPLALLKWAHVAGTFDPAFVVKNWGEANAALTLDGKPIPRGKDFRFGHRQTLEGTDLIVWVETESQASRTFRLEPLMTDD